MTRLRSKRSRMTPASGPIRMAGTARASMTPETTSPLFVVADDEREDGDVVEVVADFAHDLADPRIAVVVVAAQEREERVQLQKAPVPGPVTDFMKSWSRS